MVGMSKTLALGAGCHWYVIFRTFFLSTIPNPSSLRTRHAAVDCHLIFGFLFYSSLSRGTGTSFSERLLRSHFFLVIPRRTNISLLPRQAAIYHHRTHFLLFVISQKNISSRTFRRNFQEAFKKRALAS